MTTARELVGPAIEMYRERIAEHERWIERVRAHDNDQDTIALLERYAAPDRAGLVQMEELLARLEAEDRAAGPDRDRNPS